jgi:hypothetical protein
MARSIEQIYAAIIAYKDNQSFLQDLTPQNDTAQQLATALNSTSKVSIWRLWAYTVAVAIHVHEVLFDLFKIEIDKKIQNAIAGTLGWYQHQVFKFQFGDTLVYNPATGESGYAVIDPSKQIVKRCAVNESQNGFLLFKVAKVANNLLSALSQTEQDALKSYLSKVRFAGTKVQVISGNGDIMRIEMNIIYDPITPQSIVAAAVKIAIENHISNLDYNAEFRVIRLIDAIQAVEGVVDVSNTIIKSRLSNTAPYVTILVSNIPNYGYYRLDASQGNTLDDTVTYQTI